MSCVTASSASARPIQMAAFKPASGMNPDTIAAYAQNILTITRQVTFNPATEQSVDVVLSRQRPARRDR